MNVLQAPEARNPILTYRILNNFGFNEIETVADDCDFISFS